MAAQNRLIDDGVRDMLGAFPIGPVFGDDYLPLDPVEAMRQGKAHRVPLIVGTNADEGRLFTRFLQLLPTTEPMIEALLAEVEPAARERITGAYPDYPDRSACIRLGGDFAFSSAAWEIAEAHGQARARLSVPVRLRTSGAALVWAGGDPRHRTARGLRYLPHQVRGAAHRARRSTVGSAGHQRSAKALAVIQPHGQPR